MSNVTFKTARGSTIDLACDKYGIGMRVNGGDAYRSIQLTTDAVHGLCVKTTLGQLVIAPVPADFADAVTTLFADHLSAVRASLDADMAYESNKARVLRGMEG